MIRSLLCIFISSLAFVSSGRAQAKISIGFAATVTEVKDAAGVLDGEIAVGSAISGELRLNGARLSAESTSDMGVYEFGENSATILRAGILEFRSAVESPKLRLEIHKRFRENARSSPQDVFLLRSYQNVSNAEEVFVEHISWQIEDPGAKSVNIARLSDVPVSLARWRSPVGLCINGSDARGNEFFIRAKVATISRLPNGTSAQ